ncbi:capsule transport protein KpsE [Catenovulum agarivorans DS-2]|uniref:Capsule transport protein KpsE n=1 Tax=Catenovulum agarivorans DS-2 TaxID=1328313 RepID=W7QBR2_9ALTE|nr:sugar transporter [Catenovulum agarivorans]EWH10279.1 capsule transport protein KpsE [Catenovulum agarivorans DS-2]
MARKLKKLFRSPKAFLIDSIGFRLAKEGADTSSKMVLSFHYVAWLVVPVVALAIYLFVIASDQYESTATLVIKTSDEPNLAAGASLPLLGIDGGQSKDAYLIQKHILSKDMLKHLQQNVQLRAHFSQTNADWVSRLSADATFEDFYQYYLDKVNVEFDDISGLISLSVRTFEADYSYLVINEIIQHAEAFINQLGHQIALEEVAFVEKELNRSHENLSDLTAKLTQFQNKQQVFSTEQQSTAVLGSIAELNSLMISKKTEVEALLSYMNPTAAEVVTLQNQIKAIETQITEQQSKLISDSDTALNELDIQYRNLKMQIDFAADVYKAALLGLETTRAEVHKKLKHLLVVEHATVADEALYPRRFYWFVTLTVLLAMMYGILVMVLATVKEHKED